MKSGGEWISSIQLENAAMGHPKVLEAAVIGIPDEKWGERPLLVVVPHAGITGTFFCWMFPAARKLPFKCTVSLRAQWSHTVINCS